MAKNHKVAYVVWFLLFVGVSGFLLTSANADKYFTFEIQPNTVAGFQNIELPNVLCYTKVTTEGFDKSGKVVLTENSQFFQKRPITTFSLVGGVDKSEITKFEITPKIRCEVDLNVPMTITTANLKAFVMAKNSKNVQSEVWNGINTGKDIPIKDNHEVELTKFTVNTVDLFKYMEKGQYTTLLTFQVTGDMSFVYVVTPNAKPYNITVPRDSVQTYVDLEVTKDVTAQTKPEDDTRDSDPKTQDRNITPVDDDLKKLGLCITTADITCLTQQNYIPYYIGGIGFVFLIGAMTTRNHPVFDAYGNRLR